VVGEGRGQEGEKARIVQETGRGGDGRETDMRQEKRVCRRGKRGQEGV